MGEAVRVGRPVPNMGTVQKAAQLYGLSPNYIRRLCKLGKVRYVDCGNRWLVNLDSLARYFEQGDVPADQPSTPPAHGGRPPWGRCRKRKPAPFKYWASAEKNCIEKKFNQIGASMYRDKRIQALKPKTFLVYQCCMLESAGQESFKLPADAALRGRLRYFARHISTSNEGAARSRVY